MKKVILFGASGNIGSQTLEILKANTQKFSLTAFSVGDNDKVIATILNDFKTVKMVYANNVQPELQTQFPQVKFIKTDVTQLLNEPGDLIINALSGFFGVKVTLAALQQEKIVLNANKESFVVAGALIQNY
ncbi:hypothetical protein [Spiroplasma clarkii]|uniref:hypothetical protein n=1 Tax=Spiroplasma clarkii TaxID=2139 RepID=UPI0011BAA9F2|nr:hypothetical protein [Spiroplasma clarkii]